MDDGAVVARSCLFTRSSKLRAQVGSGRKMLDQATEVR